MEDRVLVLSWFPGLVEGAEGGGNVLLSWPSKMRAGYQSFFRGKLKGGAKEDLGRPAPGQGHPGTCLFGASGHWPGVRELFG